MTIGRGAGYRAQANPPGLSPERPDDQTRARLLALHQPRDYGGVPRCTTCAVYRHARLRRALWPCATAKILGVTS